MTTVLHCAKHGHRVVYDHGAWFLRFTEDGVERGLEFRTKNDAKRALRDVCRDMQRRDGQRSLLRPRTT